MVSFVTDELNELGCRQRKRSVAKLGDPQRHLGVSQREIDFMLQLVDAPELSDCPSTVDKNRKVVD
jgi:hypothetical protein